MAPEAHPLTVAVSDKEEAPAKILPLAGEYVQSGEHNEAWCYAQVKPADCHDDAKVLHHLYYDGNNSWRFGTLPGGWGTGIALAAGSPGEVPSEGWQTRSGLFGTKTACPQLTVTTHKPSLVSKAMPRCGSGCSAGLTKSLRSPAALCSPKAGAGSSPGAGLMAKARSHTASFANSAQAAHEKHWPTVKAKGAELAEAAKDAHAKHWPVVRAKTQELASQASETARRKANEVHAWATHPDTRNFVQGVLEGIWEVVTKTAEAACPADEKHKKNVEVTEDVAQAHGSHGDSGAAPSMAAPAPAAAASGETMTTPAPAATETHEESNMGIFGKS